MFVFAATLCDKSHLNCLFLIPSATDIKYIRLSATFLHLMEHFLYCKTTYNWCGLETLILSCLYCAFKLEKHIAVKLYYDNHNNLEKKSGKFKDINLYIQTHLGWFFPKFTSSYTKPKTLFTCFWRNNYSRKYMRVFKFSSKFLNDDYILCL